MAGCTVTVLQKCKVVAWALGPAGEISAMMTISNIGRPEFQFRICFRSGFLLMPTVRFRK